ncbi:MAG: 30S ribosome-binding factor RbfA [Salibacteraceae bacterium]
MGTLRQNKVESLLKRDLGTIFQQHSKDYGVSEMVSVTTVRISPDLSFVKVYLSIFPSKNAKETVQTISRHTSSIRGTLGKKIGKQVRIVPELAFYVDDSLDYADKIDRLLR